MYSVAIDVHLNKYFMVDLGEIYWNILSCLWKELSANQGKTAYVDLANHIQLNSVAVHHVL